jgi:altronate dehydratase small subunit
MIDAPIDAATDRIDRRLLLLAEQDNVVVACVNLRGGEAVTVDGMTAVMSADAPLGFKIARRDLAAGEKILKYGAIIGSATVPIRRGDVVHLHNMKSDYLPTYAHEHGSGFTKR